MSNIRELETLIEARGGVITSKLVDGHNIHREYLRKLIRQGKLERVAYGVNITPDVWEDKMSIHLIVSANILIFLHSNYIFTGLMP